MNLEQAITLVVGGAFTLAVLSIVLAPQGPTASIIAAAGKSLGNLTIAAKSYPQSNVGYQS